MGSSPSGMPMTVQNPFDSITILDGIRSWVEIETPTEAPEQVNKLASQVAGLYRDLARMPRDRDACLSVIARASNAVRRKGAVGRERNRTERELHRLSQIRREIGRVAYRDSALLARANLRLQR